MRLTPRALVASSLVFAAGCASTPQAASPSGGRPTVVRSAAKGDVVHAMTAALTEAGHACVLDKDGDPICDKDKEKTPTFAVVYGQEHGVGAYVGYVSSFRWKDAGGCAANAPKLVELTGKLDLLRLMCTPELMMFAMTLPIPENGLTNADVARTSTAFIDNVQAVLSASELTKALQ